jgi:dipeptidyl aminopeptidase/acylaminoacyl peptidase
MDRLALIFSLAATCGLAACATPGAPESAASSPTAAIPKKYDVRDFFRRPERSAYQLSPDGKQLAFRGRHNGRQNIFVQSLDPAGPPRPLTDERDRDVPGYFWKGNGHIVYVKDFGGDENFRVLAVPIDGSAVKDLTPYDGVRARIVSDLEDDPDHLLLSHNRRDRKVFDVFRVNIRTGTETQVAQNPGNIVGWGTDHAHKLRIAVATDGVNQQVLYRDDESQPFRTIVNTDFRDRVAPLFFTFDNRQLYVSSNRGRDKAAIFEFDPQTGREGKLIYEHPDVDVASLGFSRLRKVLTVVNFNTTRPGRHYLDKDAAALRADIERLLPGYEVVIGSMSRDEQRMVVGTYNDRTRGARHLYDRRTKKLEPLGQETPWLAEADMAPMRPVSYKARDGLTIPAYLTLPVGMAPKNLPVVIHPHGGPSARDGWGFDSVAQFLANRGYAVLQPNFRGSTGYGRAFWTAGFKQWGRAMQDDLTDGVNWLIAQGIADPKRVAIYGASYGGYATLAGLTFTPDLYAAGVSMVGPSNISSLLAAIPPYWKPMAEMMYEQVGHPEKDKDLLRAASPLFSAERIKAPLFVAQGARDPRVPKSESDQIVEALRKRNVPVQYLVKDNEGHGFANEENRFEFFEAMEKFLREHIGGR